MKDEKKKEFSRRIAYASKTELIVIMYEIIEEYIKEAQDFLNQEVMDREEYLFSLKKAKDFINELASSLDMRFPVSYQLISLYNYVRSCLIKAELRQEKNECHEALKETQKVMERLKLSFSEVSKKDHSGSVIEGSQKVYAGLTYGPGSRLNETVIR